MNKKNMLFLILFTLLFIMFLPIYIYSYENEETDDENILSLINSLETSSTSADELNVNSSHIIALDRNTGRILYEKDAFSTTPMASTTKILTSIIAIENCNLTDEVLISSKAANTSGSTLGIQSNSKMTMEDLLYGLMLRSGNDCAVAIAEHIGGSVENFSTIMNKKAKSIGLKNSNFVTPHGLDNPNHYTTAYELAVLTNYALKNETFLKIVGTKSTVICNGTKAISNTNELLGNFDGVYGVKTGFTFNAGRCLVTACRKNGLDFIVVVIGADTKKTRTTDSIKTLNYVIKNYSNINLEHIINDAFNNFSKYYTNSVTIEKSTEKPELEISYSGNTTFPLLKSEISKIVTTIYSLSKLETPTKENFKVGTLNLKIDNEILINAEIRIKNSLHKKTWKNYFLEIIKNTSNFFEF